MAKEINRGHQSEACHCINGGSRAVGSASSKALAAAIGVMFENPKTVALGIASTPSFNRDPDGVSRQAALNLIEGAINGALAR